MLKLRSFEINSQNKIKLSQRQRDAFEIMKIMKFGQTKKWVKGNREYYLGIQPDNSLDSTVEHSRNCVFIL